MIKHLFEINYEKKIIPFILNDNPDGMNGRESNPNRQGLDQ